MNCGWLHIGLCTTYKFDAEPVFTFDGDGTVVEPSQTAMMNIPGLEASRLYRQGFMSGDLENQLWEPNRNADVEKLYLDPATGESLDSGIYTRDIIDQANVVPDWTGTLQGNIYKSFISSMNSLLSAGTIKEWKPFPYDWRYDIDDVVNNPINTTDGSYSMMGEIERLAGSSDTGKVIIIGHSNGGLVGKALLSKLVEVGRPNMAEKFIMVAVPQLGTPQAISSLLHGDGLPGDMFPILMNPATARTFGESMPSGYNLLPSPEYFRQVLDPAATFDATAPITAIYRQKYGTIISNPLELHGFLLGDEGRTKPMASDMYTPNTLNSTLLMQGEQNHVWLDNWSPPAGVEMIQIAGWGIDTVSGINYKQTYETYGGLHPVLDHEPIMTSDGDGTVVVPSATASSTVKAYYVNLLEHNTEWGVSGEFGLRHNRTHEDIFEVEGLEDLIKGIIRNIYLPTNNIYETKPPVTDAIKKLRLKIHSPVSLDIYNSFGDHTGVSTSTNLGDIRFTEEQIPNSYYLEMGEGKYAGTEENGTTTIKLIGESSGTFTLDIENVQGNSAIATTTFADIPVLQNSVAMVETNPLSVTVPTLQLDINGDGTMDANIDSGVGISADDLVGIMRGMVKTLNLPTNKEQKLLKKIEKLEKVLDKEYKNEKKEKMKTAKAFEKLEKTIAKFQKKNLLTKEEADELISMLGQIKSLVVK
ncbi:MAG: hypothetical protein WC878_05490 [Candidatus Paceibacterota bacterium]